MKKLRRQIHLILEISPDKKGLSWFFDLAITSLIALNVVAIVLESVVSIREDYAVALEIFEYASILIFTVEYFLRVWASVEMENYKSPFSGRIKFIFSPLAIVDFLAVFPFFLTFTGVDLRFIRIMRLFRLFRLFKIGRYVKGLNLMGQVIREKREQLVLSLILVMFMLLLTSSLMYYIENEAQPESFTSIPETMWWGIATLTTVGYGDMYPITPLGQFFGGLISILGIGLFALPTGILASGFTSRMDKNEKIHKDCECPECGHQFNKLIE